MNCVHGRRLQLRLDLAATDAGTLDGLRVKAAAVASDFGYDPARADMFDWTTFDPLDAIGMSVLRDLLLMEPI
jgi:hypothetical protein